MRDQEPQPTAVVALKIQIVPCLLLTTQGRTRNKGNIKNVPFVRVVLSLLEKEKLAREISYGKNEIPHKFLGRKI